MSATHITPEIEPLWDVRQVAAYFGCSTSAVYKWTEYGPRRGKDYLPKLPCIRLGALVRYRPSSVVAWATDREQFERAANVVPLPAGPRPTTP